MVAANRPPLLVLLGPTASGKSDLALALAERWQGEILSADSVQVYRRLDIGSAKPTPAQRRAVPHHLIDLVEPDQPFSVAIFRTLFEETLRAVVARGHLPILVGGSGLYLRAVLKGFDFGQTPGDPNWRAQLAPHLPTETPGGLDRRRRLRAMELARRARWPGISPPDIDVLQIGLQTDRAVLYDRINRRTEAMLAAGFLEEVSELRHQGYPPGLPSLQTVGYREANLFLDGWITREELRRLWQRNTRHFAKRQLTWWRREQDIDWVGVNTETLDRINHLIANKWKLV